MLSLEALEYLPLQLVYTGPCVLFPLEFSSQFEVKKLTDRLFIIKPISVDDALQNVINQSKELLSKCQSTSSTLKKLTTRT